LRYEAHGGVSCKSSGKQELHRFNSSNGVTPKNQEDQLPDVEILLTEEGQMEETLVEYGTSQVESHVQVWKDLFDNCNMFFDAIPHEEEVQSEQIPDSEDGHTENKFQNDLQVSNVSHIACNKIHAEEMGDIGNVDEQVVLSDEITGKEDDHAERPLENEAEETKTEENIQSTQLDSVYNAPNLLPSFQPAGESRREQFYGQCYHEDLVVEMDKETAHSSANSSGVLSEECVVNDSAEKENSSGVNGMLLVHPLEFCGTSEQKLGQAGKMGSCKVEAYAAHIVITSALYDDSSESQGGQKDSSLSGTPLKKLELMSSSNISLCSENCGTLLKKSGLRSGTSEMCHSGMNDSAMKESEETLLIDPCKKNLYELDTPLKLLNDSTMKESEETLLIDPCKKNLYELKTPLKLSELIKGHEELCTPLKKAELLSSTNVSPCSGIDNFSPQERQGVLISESCKLEIPEFDTLLKIPELTKGPEKSLCLNSLAGEDSTPEKPEFTSVANVFPCSGMDDSAAEQIQEVLLIEHCKLGLPELDTPSKMSESRKSHEKSLCLYTFTGDDTELKKTELTSIPNGIPYSGINDSSAELSLDFLTTEYCELRLPELGTLSNMFEVLKSYEKSPCLGTLSGENIPLMKIELTSNTNITPCSDDSSIEQSNEILSTEACNLGSSQLDKTFDCTKDNDISPCLNVLSVEDFGTTLKYNNDLSTCSGMDGFSVEHSREVLSTEPYKLDLSEFNTPSKIPELTKDSERSSYLNTLFAEDIGMLLKKPELTSSTDMSSFSGKLDHHDLNDHDRFPCLNTLFVEDTHTSSKNSVIQEAQEVFLREASKHEVSQMDDSAVEQSGDVFPTKTCKLEPLTLNFSSKMPELRKDHDISPCLNTLLIDDIVPTLKNFEHTSSISPCSGIVDSAVKQSGDALPVEAYKLELEISENTPSKMPELTKDHDRFPYLNTLFTEDIATSLKKPEFMRGIDDSAVEQSGDALPTDACKLEISENTPSKMPELAKDHDISPSLNTLFVEDITTSLKKPEFMRGSDMPSCLNILFVDSTVPSLKNSELTFTGCSGIDDSVVEKSGDALPTDACKLEISENTPSRMPELKKDHDITPCLNTLFVEDIATSLKNPEFMSGSEMHMPSCLNILFVDSTVPSLKNSALTSRTGMSPRSGIDDSDLEQSGDVLPTDSCQLELSELNTPSAMPEFTKEDGRSPCLNILFVEDIATSLKKPELTRSTDMPLSSGMDDSAVEQSKHVLLTDACKPELSELDTSSKMAEFRKEQDRSPCLSTLFLENLYTSFKKPEITSSTHVPCCSGMNEFDNTLKMSRLSKGHSLSASLNMLAGGLGTALEMPEPTNSTDISASSGVGDSVLHKIQEIHWTQNFKHDQRSQVDHKNTSCSSTQSQRPKLEDIDDLLQYAGMDDSAPEQSLEILPTEASKQQCYHSDTQLNLGEPMEGHNNPCSQSKLAVERDLNKLSLMQLRRMYKEKLIRQKESEKVAEKHPALQDFQSNVFGEERSLFRKPEFTENYKVSPSPRIGYSFQEQSQQACQTALGCNEELFQVNTPLNEAEATEGCDKLDRPEEYSTGCNDLHQASVVGIRLPELTNNYKESLCSVIDGPIPEQSQLAYQTDLCCNNEPSQVYTPLKESEITEGYCNLDRPEEYNTASKDVPYPVSVAVIRLHTPGISCEVQQSEERDKPSKMHTSSNTLELAEGYDKPECKAGYAPWELSVSRIKFPETSFPDEREVWVCVEEPGPFVEGNTVCMKTPASSKGELRKTSLAIRLQSLKNRLETIQSNLRGQTPELSFATPLGKGMNYKSAKKSRVPLSVSRPRLAITIESDKLASTKENPTDQTQLSLKKDQRLHKEKQINSKDSEKVLGKRHALQNLS
ncbi:hypothetical protein KI387_006064, partial [Taxus chinensis]